jgi:predicted nucleotidyltransferase
MDPLRFDDFLQELARSLEQDPRVIAVITVGSTADSRYRDTFSDHDVWLVTEARAQNAYLADVTWIPSASRIVTTARFGGDYRTVLFDDGHLLTYAVRDTAQLNGATLERYAILFDRGQVVGLAEAARKRTAAARSRALASPELLPNTAILCWSAYVRSSRGEHLSAASLMAAAVSHCLDLLSAHGVLPREATTDDLDPGRRLEFRLPDLAAQLHQVLGVPAASSAPVLLELLERELRPRTPQLPWSAVDTVRRWFGPPTV